MKAEKYTLHYNIIDSKNKMKKKHIHFIISSYYRFLLKFSYVYLNIYRQKWSAHA